MTIWYSICFVKDVGRHVAESSRGSCAGGQGEADQRWAEGSDVPVGISQHEVSGPEGLETPVLFVEQVVSQYQHRRRGSVGVAVVGPVDAVVGVAAAGRDRTAGDATAVVTDGEQVELGVGHAAGLAAVVDDHTRRGR